MLTSFLRIPFMTSSSKKSPRHSCPLPIVLPPSRTLPTSKSARRKRMCSSSTGHMASSSQRPPQSRLPRTPPRSQFP
ncbi:hypothetical protein ATCV1_z215L [Acanthocystis turfacea chlorella virus 1]|uniref:Uncharacterized protein z215L n=1 Tax=Chlorovirus heliozoae TaxID=322019 RepID=A7K8H5_9PHYC|nr:hypothetical protein ATCV1_z215L [Acanthocystis turfacea chlorella virus 1]ABT16349.1 hypothetical protein ATCV1_z215L [Acanthocystis turfacea chlorella virus 1]